MLPTFNASLTDCGLSNKSSTSKNSGSKLLNSFVKLVMVDELLKIFLSINFKRTSFLEVDICFTIN